MGESMQYIEKNILENILKSLCDNNHCKLVIVQMLGFSKVEINTLNSSTVDSTITNLSITPIVRAQNFYKNWGNQAKYQLFVDVVQDIIGDIKSKPDETKWGNLNKVGFTILTQFFEKRPPNLDGRTPDYPDGNILTKNELLDTFYHFARESQSGLFQHYLLNNLCNINNVGIDERGDETKTKWCACFTNRYEKTLGKINEHTQIELQRRIDEPDTSDEQKQSQKSNARHLMTPFHLVKNECLPQCLVEHSIKLHYDNTNEDSTGNRRSIGNERTCSTQICILNDITINVKDSTTGGIHIEQKCTCVVGTNPCICIIDNHIAKKSEGLGSIAPGLNQPFMLKQYCGENALCAVSDEDGNIISIEQCPKNPDTGESDPKLFDDIEPDVGKFKPTDLKSIKNLDINLFIYLILIFIMFILFFQAAKYITSHVKVKLARPHNHKLARKKPTLV